MSLSALATVRAALKEDLEAIVAGATYHNTVKHVYEDIGIETTEFPSLTLIFTPDMLVETKNDTWSLYSLRVPFTILCEVSSDTATGTTSNLLAQQDSLLQDVLKALSADYQSNITSDPAWNVQGNPSIKVSPIYPSGDNKGLFSVSGTIHIRNLSNTFT